MTQRHTEDIGYVIIIKTIKDPNEVKNNFFLSCPMIYCTAVYQYLTNNCQILQFLAILAVK